MVLNTVPRGVHSVEGNERSSGGGGGGPTSEVANERRGSQVSFANNEGTCPGQPIGSGPEPGSRESSGVEEVRHDLPSNASSPGAAVANQGGRVRP